jgi:DNA polymerase-1
MAEYELRSLAREVESMARAGFLVRIKTASLTTSPATYAPEKKPEPESAITGAGGLSAGSTSGPQPLLPLSPSPSPQATTEQGSLFAAPPVPEAAFPGVSSVDALGLVKDDPVALVPLESGLLVASKGREQLYFGSLEALAAALADLNKPIAVPDAKTVRKIAPPLSVLPPERWFDLSLAAYLLSPEDRGYALAQVATRWGEQSASPYGISAHPGLLLLDLQRFMTEQLTGAGLLPVFTDLELPLAPVLANMEKRGVAIDPPAFASFLDEVRIDLEGLNTRIHELAGRPFNIRSSQQLSDVLFGVLQLPQAGKTKGGATSTSQEALEKLTGKHPIIEAILEFRKLEKLRSTYLEPLPRLADKDNRIHTTFNQTATATGRLSSSNPNLQNIPIRGPLGSRMRACFVAAPGKLLVSADYSQIELRVLAHLSEDPTLLEAFRNNEDIHARTAGLLFDLPLDEVTPDMRRNAKTINFGIIYGMGPQKLAQEMHITMKEAKAFIERYFERLSKLKAFYDTIEEDAKQNGYVSTMAGRRRLTPDILSSNNQLRSQARRQAINTRLQGSAADIIKMAMLAVERDPELKGLEAELLLQIHDELLLEAPEANAEAAGKRLAALMSGIKPGGEELGVPLAVDWGAGLSWNQAH